MTYAAIAAAIVVRWQWIKARRDIARLQRRLESLK